MWKFSKLVHSCINLNQKIDKQATILLKHVTNLTLLYTNKLIVDFIFIYI